MALVADLKKETWDGGIGRGQDWERKVCVLTFGTNTHLVLSVVLEETLDTTARELSNVLLVICAVLKISK
jgi:hypothetical protein